MEVGKLAVDKNHFGQLLEIWVCQVGNKASRDFHVHTERCDHLVVDRCVQGGKQISLLSLQLKFVLDRHI